MTNELNDVKVQLEVKVHSLKEKLVDNENLTDKLKKTYECQIENLNVMVNKLTSYLKDKTVELETVRKEKERLQQTIDENNKGKSTLNQITDVQTLICTCTVCRPHNFHSCFNTTDSLKSLVNNLVTLGTLLTTTTVSEFSPSREFDCMPHLLRNFTVIMRSSGRVVNVGVLLIYDLDLFLFLLC